MPLNALRIGERLVQRSGVEACVESLRRLSGRWRVYNVEVEDAHCYFAGDWAVLVHNAKAKKGCDALGSDSNPLPGIDSTGKVHGDLPKIKDLKKLSNEQLEELLQDLKQSVPRRIDVTIEKGSHRPHGARQGAEQVLIKSIEKILRDR